MTRTVLFPNDQDIAEAALLWLSVVKKVALFGNEEAKLDESVDAGRGVCHGHVPGSSLHIESIEIEKFFCTLLLLRLSTTS